MKVSFAESCLQIEGGVVSSYVTGARAVADAKQVKAEAEANMDVEATKNEAISSTLQGIL